MRNNIKIKNGYKLTEIGVIPVDWEVNVVGEICDFVVPGRNKPKLFSGNIPWITTPDIEGKIVTSSKKELFITESEAKNVGSKIVKKNSVIITCVGELGVVAIAGNDIVINQQLHAFLPNERIEHNYLLYALAMQKNYMISIATKTAVPYMNKDNCNSIPIPIPSKSEQTAIANTLSDVDDLISGLEKLIAKKKSIKQGAMQKLLTPKEGWEVKKLGDIAEISTGNKNNQDKDENGAFPFFVRSKTVERINSYSFDGEAILIPGEGNIGSVVHYINGKFDYHQRVYKISNFVKNHIGKYIYCYIAEYFGKHAIQSSVKATVDSLRLPTFKVFEIPFPRTEKEQTQIAKILSEIDSEIIALETKLEKYKNIKLGMMQVLLTGKVRLV